MEFIKLAADLAANVFRLLRDQAGLIVDFLNPAPPSVDFPPEPFVPPFTGGQCPVTYIVNLRTRRTSDNFQQDWGTFVGIGPIQFLGLTDNPSGQSIKVVFANGSAPESSIGEFVEGLYVSISTFVRNDGQDDDCGDIPNPNPQEPTNENGLTDAPFPDIENGEDILVEGVAPLVVPSALAAALAALRLAIDAAAIGNAIANALEELDRLNRARNNERKPTPDDEPPADGKPTIVRYTFGFLEGDGYINLYPDINTKYEGIYLDIIIENIPVGFGKEFGRRSPNRYKFRKLGWVAFVSPSFSLFNFQELEFRRNCLPIPEGAIGFYYNLGLDKVINGGAIGYFNKYLPEEE